MLSLLFFHRVILNGVSMPSCRRYPALWLTPPQFMSDKSQGPSLYGWDVPDPRKLPVTCRRPKEGTEKSPSDQPQTTGPHWAPPSPQEWRSPWRLMRGPTSIQDEPHVASVLANKQRVRLPPPAHTPCPPFRQNAP